MISVDVGTVPFQFYKLLSFKPDIRDESTLMFIEWQPWVIGYRPGRRLGSWLGTLATLTSISRPKVVGMVPFFGFYYSGLGSIVCSVFILSIYVSWVNVLTEWFVYTKTTGCTGLSILNAYVKLARHFIEIINNKYIFRQVIHSYAASRFWSFRNHRETKVDHETS